MKMIASTKLAKAQRAMQNGKQYGLAGQEVFQQSKGESEEAPKKKLYLVISSDKGLCGGVHSAVSKFTRRELAAGDAEAPVMIVGDKSKAQLSRALPSNLTLTFNQIGRDIPTFADAAGVADLIISSGVEYDGIAIVYNKFVSAISYESAIVEVPTANSLKEAREYTVSISMTFQSIK